MSLVVKNHLPMQEMQETSLSLDLWVGKIPLEKGMATHSSIRAWRIPWTEEPGGLQTMGSQRAGHDWQSKGRNLIGFLNELIIIINCLSRINVNYDNCYPCSWAGSSWERGLRTSWVMEPDLKCPGRGDPSMSGCCNQQKPRKGLEGSCPWPWVCSLGSGAHGAIVHSFICSQNRYLVSAQ